MKQRTLRKLQLQLVEAMWKEAAALEASLGLLAACKNWFDECIKLQDFPKGQLDESRQPLDLSAQNSWSHG